MARANRLVCAEAKTFGCFPKYSFAGFDAISVAKGSSGTLDSRLVKALDDIKRPKDGVMYPFIDLIGEGYYNFLLNKVHRVVDSEKQGSAGGAAVTDKHGTMRMKLQNNFILPSLVMYFTGILRYGSFVAEQNLALISVQLRSAENVAEELWCVPDGFQDLYHSLDNLFVVNGEVAVGHDYTTDCPMIISSQSGRITFHSGISVTYDTPEGGGLLLKEISKLVVRTEATKDLQESGNPVEVDRPKRVRTQTDNTYGVAQPSKTTLTPSNKCKQSSKTPQRFSNHKRKEITDEFLPGKQGQCLMSSVASVNLEIVGHELHALDQKLAITQNKTIVALISAKGKEWFGDEFFTLSGAGEICSTTTGQYHHLWYSDEDELFTSRISSDLDVYFNGTSEPILVKLFKDSHRIFCIFGEIPKLMGKLNSSLCDVLSISCAPLSALQASKAVNVTFPTNSFLFVKANILRQFVFSRETTGSMTRYEASTAYCDTESQDLLQRNQLFPNTTKDGEKDLVFSTCCDMFLQFLCKEICVPFSSQLSMLFQSELLMDNESFVSLVAHVKDLSLQEILTKEPESIIMQEAMRQSIIARVISLHQSSSPSCCQGISVSRNVEGFASFSGLSYWTLRQLCQFLPRYDSLPGVTEEILLYFMTHMPLSPPDLVDRDALKIGNFASSYMAQNPTCITDSSNQFAQAILHESERLKPFTVGWIPLASNDYDSVEGGLESFCQKIRFKGPAKERAAKCICLSFCRLDCVNVAANLECNANNCAIAGHDCLNRPSLSTIHPPFVISKASHKGWGVFSISDYPAGLYIMEYRGVVSVSRAEGKQDYVLECTNGAPWFINGFKKGSISRFVNHSCEANSKLVLVGDCSDILNPPRMFLKSLVTIHKGIELTFDYQDNISRRFSCLCGTPSCRSALSSFSTAPLTSPASTVSLPVPVPVPVPPVYLTSATTEAQLLVDASTVPSNTGLERNKRKLAQSPQIPMDDFSLPSAFSSVDSSTLPVPVPTLPVPVPTMPKKTRLKAGVPGDLPLQTLPL